MDYLTQKLDGTTGIFKMRFDFLQILAFLCLTLVCCAQPQSKNVAGNVTPDVRGWTILTDIPEEGRMIIKRAKEYEVNHLQLSHHIIMDLKDARTPERAELTNQLTDLAHKEGIPNVLVWDHALYRLDYYPDKFKVEHGSKLDLDNPEFWEWLKQDYRDMLGLLPDIDGIVLTFIETGARAEEQYSQKLKTPAEKLAKVINTIAEVVIEEEAMHFFIRTFAYNKTEYDNLIACIKLLKSEKICLMMKETPHDFFLYHPSNDLVGKIDRPTLVEFDLGNEYNGQSIVANTYAEYVFDRWKSFEDRPNVMGYVGRVDRFKTTKIIDKPSEILAEALYRAPHFQNADSIYDSFILKKYGKDALPEIKSAFKLMLETIKSSFYTLGLNTETHSELNLHYPSIYVRHVAGRWMENPEVYIGHDVNKTFHYWKDVVNHLAPARRKRAEGVSLLEIPDVLKAGWIEPKELMNLEYLEYIIKEKDFGVNRAKKALDLIASIKSKVDAEDYEVLHSTFERTWVAAKMRRAVAKMFYGYRIYARGKVFQSQELSEIIRSGIDEAQHMADLIASMEDVPEGQWNWKKDAKVAREYIRKITKDGWQEFGGVVLE